MAEFSRLAAAADGKVIAYNPSLATKNLNEFKDSMGGALTKLASAYSNFIEGLDQYWFSPNALKFSSNHSNYADIISGGVSDCNSLIHSAVMAVAAIAKGCDSSFSYSGSVPEKEVNVGPLREREGTFVGIKVSAVKDLLDKFKAEVKDGIAMIDAVPSGIAVYDTSGSVKTLYGQRIAALKASIDSAVNKIDSDITKAINEQEEEINQAKAKILSAIKEMV